MDGCSDKGNIKLNRISPNFSTEKEPIKAGSSVTIKRKNDTSPDVKPEKLAHTLIRQSQAYDNSANETSDREYSIIVSNIPTSWNFQRIHSFFSQYLVFLELEVIKDNGSESKNSVQIYFESYKKYIEAETKLKNEVIDGCKLIVNIKEPIESTISILKPETIETKSSESKNSSELLQTSYVDDENIDNSCLFGLKPEYVFSLGIKPPLTQWVHVSNFRTDKNELRDVLELAGNVIVFWVVCSARRFAKVMYSHPLEAIQAISMLNGQTFYGQVLKVIMIEEEKQNLPKGLNDVGPGLGIAGKPIRDIVNHFQRFLNGKSTKLDTKLFRELVNHKFKDLEDMGCKTKEDEKLGLETENKASYHRLKVYKDNSDSDSSLNGESDSVASKETNKTKMVNTANTDTDYCKPIKTIGPRERSIYRVTNKSTPIMNAVRPTIPQPYANLPGPRLHLGNPILLQPHLHSGPRYPAPTAIMTPNFNLVPQSPIVVPDSVTVEFRNLPLTTTFPLLCQKLTEVGQIITLQLTAPGCAVVKFANRMQAENCVCRYHNSMAEGNLIEVRFI